MDCPHCKSEHTQRLEVIFDGGTTQTQSVGTTVGGGMGRGGFGGVASTTTRGTSQTAAAKKAAPPAKKSYGGAIMLCIIGGVILMSASGGFAFFGLSLAGLGIFMGVKANNYNSGEWPALNENWLISWMCNKCGAIYQNR